MAAKPRELSFVRAKANKGVPPLPQYYEEIYANNVGIKQIGLRGDKNYLFYSKDEHGAGYYERGEMKLSAQSFSDHFQDVKNRATYFEGVKQLLLETREWIDYIDNLDLSHLEEREVAALFLKANQLHGRLFSYYIVSQPYRIELFVGEIQSELAKRVARTRIDHYISLLATSEKPTSITTEEIDWLKFLIRHKRRVAADEEIDTDAPGFQRDLNSHFEKHKGLTLGDGVWNYSLEYFTHKLVTDTKISLKGLEARLAKVEGNEQVTLQTRKQLVKELYLDSYTVDQLAFLADLGHSRFTLRTDGWTPNVRVTIKLDIELSERIGYDTPNMLNFLTEAELEDIVQNWKIVPPETVLGRMGEHQEYLILSRDDEYTVIYGENAGETFHELVPAIDHEATVELRGSTAVKGTIRGKACVYQWGDDLTERLAAIKKYPILVAGQTRPAMMPLIRLAKGIVTDEGGVTSHAAIVSRELNIPSVIGTVHATQVFKDGDLIELDADNGIVRKI